MISTLHFGLSAHRVCLVLVAACIAQPLLAQPATAPAAKPKVKLAPRPLPGMGSSNTQVTPDAEVASETDTRATVPVFRPAAVMGSAPTQAETLSAPSSTQRTPQVQSGPDRARITLVRRRGTFQMPKEPAREAPVIVNDLGDQKTAVEAVPVALPPGKIRVIPRDSINVRTSLPPSQP